MDDKNLTEIGEQIVKKQKRPKRSEQLQVHTDPGDNTKYLNHALKLAALPKFDTKDIPLLQERIETYFTICAEDDQKPSVAGLALAVGVDRKTIWQWSQTENSDRSNTIKRAYQILNLMMEGYMQNGKINPVSGIFLMKNNFGYTDKQEVVLTPNAPLGEQKSDAELEQKYLESVVDENLTE
jgi:hypothetical protein